MNSDPTLPWSDASERNKEPILEVLRTVLAGARRVLEIGSGTGQHAVHFAAQLRQLDWQPTEIPASLAPLARRIALEGSANLQGPFALDVMDEPAALGRWDAVFTANTLHIIPAEAVVRLFELAARALPGMGATLIAYGPFRYRGDFTTASNARFDAQLRARNSKSGIRDQEFVDGLARAHGFGLSADHSMPANNQLLVWRRVAPAALVS
jgi:SAM-dependent methyltransferase